MRILFVADGRSAIALNWLSFFVERGDEVHLASTFACPAPPGLASLGFIPVAFSQIKGSSINQNREPSPLPQKLARPFLERALSEKARTRLRQWIGPFSVPAAGQRLKALIEQIQPDLLHAMRIPYEGMMAAYACGQLARDGDKRPPLLVSVWGNDFTLHALATPFMGNLTMRTLQSADGLHCDCHRDLRLAQLWGWNPAKASAVLPGAGGIQAKLFTPPADPQARSQPVVINPRGFRAYVRNDTFFKAAALVLAHNPKVRFVCPNMANERQAQRWLAHLDLEQAVRLLPKQTRPQMAAWFQQAQVAVSPSIHDGTPNTLLEAMACGCYPIAGDLEPLREWITPGENGDLINPGDPQALAQAILHALDDPAQREKAAHINRQLVVDRAEYGQVMARAQEFYRRLHFAG